jgi:hypothetical protein
VTAERVLRAAMATRRHSPCIWRPAGLGSLTLLSQSTFPLPLRHCKMQGYFLVPPQMGHYSAGHMSMVFLKRDPSALDKLPASVKMGPWLPLIRASCAPSYPKGKVSLLSQAARLGHESSQQLQGSQTGT